MLTTPSAHPEGPPLMMELRTYTLATRAALDEYASVHWPRHISSLAAFGITTHAIWRGTDPAEHRLIALVSYADGADPEEVTGRYMASPEFQADMSGFDLSAIRAVESVFVEPTPESPLE
jgi:hypothetical protein